LFASLSCSSGNPNVKNEDLLKWHNYLLEKDQAVIRSLGKDVRGVIETMKAGPLRLGGIAKSYANHCIVTGDAAGMIDPLTGEGIHHAMEGGKLAAETLIDAIEAGNFSEEAMSVYHRKWMDRFGFDFGWSMAICQFLYRFPIFLDAATVAVQLKGNAFLARWADIMTGRVPKVHLLHPVFSVTIFFCLIYLIIKRTLTCSWGRVKID